jgi:hypothetical protein
MVRPVQPLPARPRPPVILLRQSQGQIAEAFAQPCDTAAEQMFRRQNPGR